jgi:hypothetical protein
MHVAIGNVVTNWINLFCQKLFGYDAVLTCTCLDKCPRMPGSEPYICMPYMQDQYPDGENLTLAAANSWAAVTKGCAFQFTATKVASSHADTTAPTTTTATVTGSNAGALTIAPPRQRRRLLLLALRRPIKQRPPARLNKNSDPHDDIYTSQSSSCNNLYLYKDCKLNVLRVATAYTLMLCRGLAAGRQNKYVFSCLHHMLTREN